MLDGAQAEPLHRLLRRLMPQGWGHHRSGLFNWGFSPCEGYGSICGDAGIVADTVGGPSMFGEICYHPSGCNSQHSNLPTRLL